MNKESKVLSFLYQTFFGRFILKIISSRFISKVCGLFLSSRLSTFLIKPFIKKNNIKISEYYHDNFKCFNDCFSRKIIPDNRPIDKNRRHLIAPCDGYLSIYKINDDLVIPIKQSMFSISKLLKDKKLASKYNGGICLVFRLCVNHYHRYCYIDSGRKEKNIYIPGKLHTVRPIALEKVPVFTENSREYTIMHTDNFKDVIEIEIGALLVGKIKNYHQEYNFSKGEEKGMFQFGGSTIILLLEKDTVNICQKYVKKAKESQEIPIKMGEKIGDL